jgi:hypothetical protein
MSAKGARNAQHGRKTTASRPEPRERSATGVSRRGFLGGVGGAAALGGAVLLAASRARAAANPVPGTPLPAGAALRVKPALLYALAQRREKTSWRGYGGLQTRADVDAEAKRIQDELKALAAKADFPLDAQPLALVGTDAEAAAVAGADADALLVFASGGPQHWLERLAASQKPNVLFLRHQSGPFYLWYEIAHWRLMRKSEDEVKEPNVDFDDIVVDHYADVLWRLRALYGLKNAKGTKVLAIGGLAAYSAPGQRCGPEHVQKVWGFDLKSVPDEDVAQRLQKARADEGLMKDVARQADDLLAQPNVTLQTDKRFVVNSFLALRVFKDLMRETGATNLGVAHCMGSHIAMLDTPPCLVLSLLNDEGYTAFCHTDMTHTAPGVLLRWISGKPSFVSNSHFPHHGVMTLAHCSAPRKMNGKDFEPTQILTHFESDYGAATKVAYTKGQVTTNLIPNLTCTKWFGFRGKILDSPAYDACRSQMDVAIEGDWRRLLRTMQGFHTVTCYGDYLREVAYALRKLGIGWDNVSESAT